MALEQAKNGSERELTLQAVGGEHQLSHLLRFPVYRHWLSVERNFDASSIAYGDPDFFLRADGAGFLRAKDALAKVFAVSRDREP